jgi:hypothetical protein
MASSLLFVPRPTTTAAPAQPRRGSFVTCGPRDNRGPLPAAASGAATSALGRLLKADLVAAMAELQRQGHWSLAFAALHVARGESGYRPDPTLYATFVSSAPAGDDEAGAAVDALLEEKARGSGFVDGK